MHVKVQLLVIKFGPLKMFNIYHVPAKLKGLEEL